VLVPAPFRLGNLGHERRDQKGNTALDPGVITWLQLHFDGGVSAAAKGAQASLVAQARSIAARFNRPRTGIEAKLTSAAR
jgi:hypothetical protein